MIQGVGRRQFLKITNVSPRSLIMHKDTKVGMWLAKDQVPRTQGYVSVGSRRYAERLNLVYEATTDQVDHQVELIEEDEAPLVEKCHYETPSSILQRPKAQVPVMNMSHRHITVFERNVSEDLPSPEVNLEVIGNIMPPRNVSRKLKPLGRSTMIVQICCLILVPRSLFWISPLLVR